MIKVIYMYLIILWKMCNQISIYFIILVLEVWSHWSTVWDPKIFIEDARFHWTPQVLKGDPQMFIGEWRPQVFHWRHLDFPRRPHGHIFIRDPHIFLGDPNGHVFIRDAQIFLGDPMTMYSSETPWPCTHQRPHGHVFIRDPMAMYSSETPWPYIHQRPHGHVFIRDPMAIYSSETPWPFIHQRPHGHVFIRDPMAMYSSETPWTCIHQRPHGHVFIRDPMDTYSSETPWTCIHQRPPDFPRRPQDFIGDGDPMHTIDCQRFLVGTMFVYKYTYCYLIHLLQTVTITNLTNLT